MCRVPASTDDLVGGGVPGVPSSQEVRTHRVSEDTTKVLQYELVPPNPGHPAGKKRNHSTKNFPERSSEMLAEQQTPNFTSGPAGKLLTTARLCN